jgi:ribonuclease P protein component
MNNHSFPSSEKLKSKQLFELVFKTGKSLSAGPIKVFYLKIEKALNAPQVQAGFAVPSRVFNKAHDRNLIKRRMRTAYQLLKHQLFVAEGNKTHAYAVVFLYTNRRIVDFDVVKQKISVLLDQLQKEPDFDTANS